MAVFPSFRGLPDMLKTFKVSSLLFQQLPYYGNLHIKILRKPYGSPGEIRTLAKHK
jgi:hypothetical protein